MLGAGALGHSRVSGCGGEGSLGDQPSWKPGLGSPCCPAIAAFSGTQLTIYCAFLSRWLLNLFHSQIESKFRKILENKVRMSELLASSEPLKGWAPVLTDLWPSIALVVGPNRLGPKTQKV